MKLLARLAATAALGGWLLASAAGPALAADPTTGAAASPAMPRLGVGVGPSQVILGAAERSGTFTVYNGGEVEESFTMTSYDFVVDSEGQRVPAAEPVALGAASWLAAEPTSFTLAPGASQAVSFTFTVPTGASPGDHYTGIRVLGSISDAAWAKLKPQLGGGAIMRSQIAFPVTVVVRVPGERTGSLTADPGIPSFIFTTSDTYTFTPRIVNSGNFAAAWIPAAGTTATPESIVPSLRLASTLSLFAGDHLLFAPAKGGGPAPVTVLPGATLVQELVLADVPILGSYDYTYTLPGSETDGRAAVTATGHFVIVNLWKVLLYLVLPLAGILFLLLAWLFRRRHRAAARRRAALEKERERQRVRQEVLDELRQEPPPVDAGLPAAPADPAPMSPLSDVPPPSSPRVTAPPLPASQPPPVDPAQSSDPASPVDPAPQSPLSDAELQDALRREEQRLEVLDRAPEWPRDLRRGDRP